MNGLKADGLALAGALAENLKAKSNPGVDMLVCPPFTLIGSVGETIAGSAIALGAQDCHAHEKGAHTADISAATSRSCRACIAIRKYGRSARPSPLSARRAARARAPFDTTPPSP